MILNAAFVRDAAATNPCHRSFEFIGAFGGPRGGEIWIGEHIGLGPADACLGSSIHRIPVPDTLGCVGIVEFTVGEWDTLAERAWEWAREARVHLRTLTVDTLELSEGAWVDRARILRVEPPEPDASLDRDFYENVNNRGADWRRWVRQQEGRAVQLPVCTAGQPSLLYADPEGLYFSYAIAAAHYVPAWKILVVLTKQGHEAYYENKMHGFMVLRLAE